MNNEKITEKEIMELACGRDNEGMNNSVIKVSLSKLNVSTEDEQLIHEVTLDGPVVNIFRGYRLSHVDITFPSSKDFDLLNLNNELNNFTNIQNSLDEEAEVIPAIILTIMPKEYEGEYFITGLHGDWCLMPLESDGDVSTIRFIFENPLLHVYRLNDTDVDYDELENELMLQAYTERE